MTFALDRKLRRAVIRLMNRKTRKEIRQIAAEELLQLAISVDASTEE